MITKREIRLKMLETRNTMEETQLVKKSETIINKIINSEEYIKCGKLLTYLNMKSEIITIPLILDALGKNKTVALPVINKKLKKMVFIEIKDIQNLVKSKFGVMEPVYREESIIKSDNKTVIIVPGTAFAKDKNRIGYGGGYYDNYLSENISQKNIGVCFGFQLLEHLPVESYDVKVDCIITEQEIIL